MNVKARLQQLMQERGWTEYRLAKECGLAQSTVGGILRRNTEPSLTTLETICKGLGITLSQFFAETQLVELTPELKELFEDWGYLTGQQKSAVLQMLKLVKSSRDSI